MKTKKTELDVDFIGGQGSLTSAEERALSAFFKNRKLIIKKPTSILKLRKVRRSNVTV